MSDRSSGRFIHYTNRDGDIQSLSNNNVQTIMEDSHGDLWLGTVGGGLNLQDNTLIPPVYITDFQVFNKPVVFDDQNSVPENDVPATKSITVSYRQSVFTIAFAALSYTAPEKNKYAYRLEGFEKDWNYVGNKRTATYTNLNPGQYTFRVKASNNDDKWNETGTSITIIIIPPFWLTWWFKLIAALVLAGSVVTFYWVCMKAVKAQKTVLQCLVMERTQQLAHITEEEKKARKEADQANRSKSIFLATMSHEIRTPMNGVIGMAALLAETSLDKEQRTYAETIIQSGDSLLAVINDILDFSKIESDKIVLEQKEFAIRECVEGVFDLFAPKAVQQGLNLIYQVDPAVPDNIIGDEFRLRQVIMNLVGNAMKFTKEGEISVNVRLIGKPRHKPMVLEFAIRDTGIGIPAKKMGL